MMTGANVAGVPLAVIRQLILPRRQALSSTQREARQLQKTLFTWPPWTTGRPGKVGKH